MPILNNEKYDNKKTIFMNEDLPKMNKLDFDDMLYEKTITDQTKLDERNPKINFSNNIGSRNQFAKPLFYPQKTAKKVENNKDLLNIYQPQINTNSEAKIFFTQANSNIDELDEFDIVYKKYIEEKTQKQPEKRVTSNHMVVKQEKMESRSQIEETKIETKRPRSRIKSALHCIEEIFDIKKDNNTITIDIETRPKNQLAQEIKIEKADNLISNSKAKIESNIDIGIEKMINNFPTRPGSRIRKKREEPIQESLNNDNKVKENKLSIEKEILNFESRRKKRLEGEKSFLEKETIQNEDDNEYSNFTVNKNINRFQKI